jgi:hypothetical protein
VCHAPRTPQQRPLPSFDSHRDMNKEWEGRQEAQRQPQWRKARLCAGVPGGIQRVTKEVQQVRPTSSPTSPPLTCANREHAARIGHHQPHAKPQKCEAVGCAGSWQVLRARELEIGELPWSTNQQLRTIF